MTADGMKGYMSEAKWRKKVMKKRIRKLAAFGLAAEMTLSLAACGNS